MNGFDNIIIVKLDRALYYKIMIKNPLELVCFFYWLLLIPPPFCNVYSQEKYYVTWYCNLWFTIFKHLQVHTTHNTAYYMRTSLSCSRSKLCIWYFFHHEATSESNWNRNFRGQPSSQIDDCSFPVHYLVIGTRVSVK